MFKESVMMYKRSELMKIIAVSIVFLFLVSGFSVMIYGSGSEKSISSVDKSGNISITNSRIAPVKNSSNNTVISKISVESYPDEIAYDSSNGYVYVANYGLGTVSIISTSPQVIKKYSVTYTESGLPSGTSWSVTLNGSTLSSNTNTISFTVSNGTYSYSIGSVNGYTASSSSGFITVNGANVNQTIIFKAVATPTNYLLYIIIVIVVIIAVLLASMAMRRGKNKGAPKQWQEPPRQKPPQQ